MSVMTFSRSLRRWIKKNGLVQRQAAKILKVRPRTLTDWLGVHHIPHSDRQQIVIERMSKYETDKKT